MKSRIAEYRAGLTGFLVAASILIAGAAFSVNYSRAAHGVFGDLVVTGASTLTGAITATAGVTGNLTGNVTSTGANTFGTVLFKDLTEVVAATNVITAAESGSVFFLSHATEFVSTLPAPAAGLHFTFIVANAPETASYTVIAAASATIIVGHVLTSQDAGGNADSETSGALTVTFVDSKAVVGDSAEFWCDGTNWFVTGRCKTFDAITIS
jgi:hypothetical protein